MVKASKNNPDQPCDLLILGGDADPNILRLVLRANELGVNMRAVLVGKSGTPRVTVDVLNNALIVEGKTIRPKAVFIRPNVFEYLETKEYAAHTRAEAWFSMFIGWILANPDVRFLNRRYYHRNGVNKLETLLMARQLGFMVTETYFTNDAKLLTEKAAENAWIEKPVEGGAHTQMLQPRDPKVFNQNVTSAPTTIQRVLIQPEIRVFRIGQDLAAFKVASDKLDYREASNTTLEHVGVPAGFEGPFMQLTERLGLDYAAADFKTDEKSGDLALLEVNSGAMFAGFDRVSDGALTAAMIKYLVKSG